nr:CAB/ELIP/HLIP superfamily protein [Cyanidiaceae sp.]
MPKYGFHESAELLNGRLAMLAFMLSLITEFITEQKVLHFLEFFSF